MLFHHQLDDSASRIVSVSEKYINELLLSKLDWIRNQQEKFKISFQENTFVLLGKNYPLKKQIGRNGLQIEEDVAVLCLKNPNDSNKEQAVIKDFYKKVLKEYIKKSLPFWESATGLKAESWQIRDMKTRWGSCNTRTKKLWFNLQLAKKDTECIDYVILHELAHIKIPNHSNQFKNFLFKYMPDWKDRKKKINQIK